MITATMCSSPLRAYGIYGLDVAKPYEPGTEVYEYSYRDAELEGTAYISGDHIDGLGENAAPQPSP